jgi:prepilin-type N-terminal cleavage/methylation domain-containing protein
MASRKISTAKRFTLSVSKGFTLIEVIIAIAIFIIMLSFGLFISMDALHSTYSRSERDTVVSLLSKARSRSLANIDGAAWGVCYISASQTYVLFSGATCDPSAATSEVTSASAGVAVTWGAPAIFSQLSGTTSPTEIVLNEQNKTSTTTINYEGTIIW